VVFSEVMPKTYAITNPERAAVWLAPLVKVFVTLLSPVVTLVRAVVRLLLRLFGVIADPDASIMAAHEEIAGTIALHHSEGAVQKADRDRLLGALDLRHRAVEEIMLHRSGIEMVDAAAKPQEILTQCLRSPYTRLPVFRDEPENIIGVIHAKDLLRAVDKLIRGSKGGLDKLSGLDVTAVAMEPYFIPNTTTLDDQMREFLKRKTHFALVVDEYGTLQGLITLEDILEEIVGEISDEHDVEAEVVERGPDGSVVVDGLMTIRDINRACDWNLPDEEANTVAGLVIHEAQTIPTVGQVFTFHGFRFEVLARERNRLTRLRLRRMG
jgi:Mg2+/Co2+ transporter CorB